MFPSVITYLPPLAHHCHSRVSKANLEDLKVTGDDFSYTEPNTILWTDMRTSYLQISAPVGKRIPPSF